MEDNTKSRSFAGYDDNMEYSTANICVFTVKDSTMDNSSDNVCVFSAEDNNIEDNSNNTYTFADKDVPWDSTVPHQDRNNTYTFADKDSEGTYSFTANESDTGIRLDKLLAEQFTLLSRSRAANLIDEGLITVNGKKTGKKATLKSGDTVKVIIPETIPAEALPEDIPIDIVYEDSDLYVVNKPKGMVVHPAPGNPGGTLVNALLFCSKGQLSGINGVIRPGIVHRIDKNTSGLLVVAKTDSAHRGLAAQIAEHSFTREYLAVCTGGFRDSTGVIEAPIGRNPHDRKKMCVINDPRYNARPAKTEYTVLDSHDGFSLLRLKLYTGRTHQIRVHLSYINHPVFGDDVYGKASNLCVGQCLHAAKLGFLHPVTGDYMEFTAPLPEYFTKVLNKLKLDKLRTSKSPVSYPFDD